jgi:CHAD domain-containing protein
LFVTKPGVTSLLIVQGFSMAYRLKVSEPLAEALPRIVCEQIERIRETLSDQRDSVTSVHETRKCLKRIRALLKLARPGLHAAVYDCEANRYRTIAGTFSAARDRDVMASTLADLIKSARADERDALVAIQEKVLSSTVPVSSEIIRRRETDLAILAEAEAAALALVVEGHADTLQHGLRATYRKGRRLQREAYDDGSDEAFHELRKSVQVHWRHMQLFQKAWPEMYSARIEAARSLSQMLGDVQDMAVLIEAIKARDDLPDDAASTVVGVARASQRRARKSAPAIGQQIFAQRSGEFARCTIEIWTAAANLE